MANLLAPSNSYFEASDQIISVQRLADFGTVPGKACPTRIALSRSGWARCTPWGRRWSFRRGIGCRSVAVVAGPHNGLNLLWQRHEHNPVRFPPPNSCATLISGVSSARSASRRSRTRLDASDLRSSVTRIAPELGSGPEHKDRMPARDGRMSGSVSSAALSPHHGCALS